MISCSQIARNTALHILSLLVVLVLLTQADLTIYSGAYLAKICGISLLLFVGTCFLAREVPALDKLTSRLYTLFIATISNLIFLPFLTLLSQREHLSLWLPACLIMCFFFLKESLMGINKGWLQQKKYWLKPVREGGNLPESPLFQDKIVLLYGVKTALGKAWLDSLCSYLPQQILLIDADLIALEAAKIQLQQKHPNLIIHLFPASLSLSAIQSLFKSYQPDIVLDFSRYFCVPSADGGLTQFLKSNLLVPYWLAVAAHQATTHLMISLHPILLMPLPFLKQPQQILTSALQRYDSSRLRVLNIQVPLSCDEPNFSEYIEILHQRSIRALSLISADSLLADLFSLGYQLISNPIHHGALWTPLMVKKISALKLKTLLKSSPLLPAEVVREIKETKTPLKVFALTSHPRIAILKEDFFLTHDVDAYFSKLDLLLQENPSQIEAFLSIDP